MPSYAFGRLPHDPRPARVKLRRLPGATLTPPAQSDWGCDAMNTMGLNDRIGDCTIASKSHIFASQEFYGQNRTVVIPDASILKAYSDVSGYDPNTGANDNGATMQDSLDYTRKTGLVGPDGTVYRIEAFAQIEDPANQLDLVRTVVDAFGVVDCGLSVPDYALDQFDAGQEWDLKGRRLRIVGGHCVPIIGYGADYFDCWTWGRRQRISLPFFQRLFDEVWAVGEKDWRRADGTVPNGLDAAAANAQFKVLTGQDGPGWTGPDGPPPDPNPTPDPDPTPDPVPPADADLALKSSFEAWIAAKGL